MPASVAWSGRCVRHSDMLLRRARPLTHAWLTRAALALATLATLAACGGGSAADGPATVPPGFSVTLSASTLTVTAGSIATVSATIARTGTLTSAITLSAEGLPAGLSALFDPAEISPTTTTASLTVTAAATVPPAAYTFTVRGESAGLTDVTIPATVTVRAAPAFTLAVTPAAATVQAGASTQGTLQLTRTEFTEAVALSITGLPTGATATFSAPSLTGDSTTLIINTTVATTPGVYTLAVRGTSSLATRAAVFTLTVTAPPDFSIAVPTTASVRQGTTSAPLAVTVTRTGGFTAPVTLSFEGLPNGVTATPATLPVAGTSAEFTLMATANAAVGIASVTIRAKANGLADRVTTFTLTVTPDPGSFTLAVGAIVSAAQGQAGSTPITIVRTAPFTGPVALTVSGLPTGVTAIFGPSTIIPGATTSTLSLAVSSAAATGVYPVIVHATAPGLPEQTSSVSLTVTAAPSQLVSQHLLAQEGLAIALASTVLQSQIQVLFAVSSTGQGSAQACAALTGGGSAQSLPVGADNPSKAGIYYDAACTKPYIIADVTAKPIVTGRATLTETATYYGPTGTLLGVMNLQETAQIGSEPIYVAGLGTFAPASGAQSVRLGLTCVFNQGAVTTAPCYGGIEQYVPTLARTLGSVTPLTLTIGATTNDPITFTGANSVLRTGAQGTLTLSLDTPTSLAISGGTAWGTSTQQGSAANFSLFPPTPTGWTVTDAEHDMRFTINVASNVVRNSVGQITQISTGAVLATIAIDQSGTGTITWSDGRTVAVTGWTFAD
jgi:hypothetical protein